MVRQFWVTDGHTPDVADDGGLSGSCHVMAHTRTRAHTQQFNGPLSGTTRVIQYQRGKTNLDFTEARDSEWQWHQLGHMQTICILVQTDNHTSSPPLKFFTARMPFLSPDQQCQEH